RVQRVVRRPPSPESIQEPFELRLPDGAQYLGHHTLDDFVFQRWHPQSSLPSVCFRDVHPSHCRCSIASSSQPSGEPLKVSLEFFSIVLPRLSIDPCRRVLLQAQVRLSQILDFIHMVVQRRHPLLRLSPHCLPYAFECLLHVFLPALCPGHGTLIHIPLDQPPSLHPLRRCPMRNFVRRLRWYYAAVRLPVVVHHRRASSDF